jgi:hypothetical protein
MSKVAFSRTALALFASLSALSPARAQSAPAVGVEFQVNTYTPNYQGDPAAAMDGDGDFVVVWASNAQVGGQDGSYRGIFGRRFDSAGFAQGAEFLVNAYTSGIQSFPVVAMDLNGDFVVVWEDAGRDGSGAGIFAQRFDDSGVKLGAELQINAYTPGPERFPVAAMRDDGGFVVTWSSFNDQDGSSTGVFARRFDAAGTPLAAEFQVSTYTQDTQAGAAVAIRGIGDFVVAWSSRDQDGSSHGVFFRRFDALGAPLGVELQVNSYTESSQGSPAVAIDDAGGFVVAWESYGQDGYGEGIFARRFDAAGNAQSAEFQVNASTEGGQYAPVVTLDAGGFVVAWSDFATYDVLARGLDAAGLPQGSVFRVNTYDEGFQHSPAVAADDDGDFVVAWTSQLQDGSSYGVFAQRYEQSSIVLDIDGNGSVAPLTDGLLVLRFLFGFSGTTLVSGAVDLAGCTRCNASSIAAYLGTLI